MSVKRYIGDYEVVRRLRVGGMATLYLARRHGAAGFSRQVAIKVVHPHLVDQPAFAQMFVDEARICSQIAHPNVVHVEEFGEVDGLHYLVMEYIDGCSCSELLHRLRADGNTLDPVVAARIIMAAAAGLHAAHETTDDDGQPLDVVHRDVSPSNILLTPSGHVKLIDFGIAKARNRVQETEAGFSMKGKYRYVAPEQATRTHVDRRSDIFSLGVVFWELLTGQSLFADDTQVGLFNRLTETNARPPSTVAPTAPAALDAVVLAMLRHDPADRPATAAEVAKLISAALPAAAATDPGVLGALVADTRARRRGQSASMSAESELSHSSLPDTRRSQRMAAAPPDPDYAIEITAPDPTIAASPPPPPALAPPAPTPRRSRWLVPAALVGGLILLGIGVLVGSSGDNPPAAAASATPGTPPAAPASMDVPVGVVPAPAAAAPVVDTADIAEAIPAPTPKPNPGPAKVLASTETAKLVRAPRVTARPQARPTPRPQPAVVATPTRAPAPARTKTKSATFVHASFDDDAAESTKPAAAPSKVKVKSTTIVTEFGD